MMDFFLMRITLNPENVQMIAAIKRAMTPVQKQWLTIREIRMRMEEDKSFKFMSHTKYTRRMAIHFYMLRSPETKKLFVHKTGPVKEDRFALKENLRCNFCRGPFASDEAVPEICQSCCAVWHPDCLPLMAAGTSAAQLQCSECVKTGCRPHRLELEAGPSGQGMSGGAPPPPPTPPPPPPPLPFLQCPLVSRCRTLSVEFHDTVADSEVHVVE